MLSLHIINWFYTAVLNKYTVIDSVLNFLVSFLFVYINENYICNKKGF